MSVPLLPFQERIHAAIADRQVLTIRGTGSKDFLGHPARAGTQVLETTTLNGIISHEPSELVITAYAGTPLQDIEQALAQHGQWLPFDPPHYQGHAGTVGGMVAAGMAGPARVAVGGVRDHVLGLAMFNGLGSKGSLLAPKMAAMLAGHLLSGDAIPRDIDVRRRMAGERP